MSSLTDRVDYKSCSNSQKQRLEFLRVLTLHFVNFKIWHVNCPVRTRHNTNYFLSFLLVWVSLCVPSISTYLEAVVIPGNMCKAEPLVCCQ